VTLLPVDALAATSPRTESPSDELPARTAPRLAIATSLPPRQPRFAAPVSNNTAGLAVPSVASTFKLAAARLRALEELAGNVERDMGEAYQAVAGHFEAQIADARAEVESLKA
jgi:hypothetical protein